MIGMNTVNKQPPKSDMANTCEKCKETFPTSRGLKNHNRIDCLDANYKGCSSCKKVFSSSAYARKHHKMFHNQGNWNQKCECDVCGHQFNQTAHLRLHKKTMHSGKPSFGQFCGKCGKQFINKQLRDKHRTDCLEYICSEKGCKFKSNSYDGLWIHRSATGHLTSFMRSMSEFDKKQKQETMDVHPSITYTDRYGDSGNRKNKLQYEKNSSKKLNVTNTKLLKLACVSDGCEFQTTSDANRKKHVNKNIHQKTYQRFPKKNKVKVNVGLSKQSDDNNTSTVKDSNVTSQSSSQKGKNDASPLTRQNSILNEHDVEIDEASSESNVECINYNCHLCEFTSLSATCTFNHLQEVHSISYKLVDPRGISAMKLACFLCGKRYHSYQILKLHLTCDHQTNAVRDNPKDDSPAISTKPEENLPFLTTETLNERELAFSEY